MTIGTKLAGFGLDMSLFNRTGSALEMSHLSDLVISYDHSIDSFGGFLTAGITLGVPDINAEWWYERALGMRVKVTCNAGQPVWEGFINEISLSSGSDTEVRGPLMNVGNMISVVYSPINYANNPPTAGSEVLLAPTSDLISQSRYGILQKVISGGQCSDAMAAWIQALSMADLVDPKISGTINLSGNNKMTVKLDCLGLIYWLFAYIYNNVTAGDINLSDKILAILTADPNGLLSTDYSGIMVNTMQVGAETSGNRYAADVIKELVALGDAAYNNRTLFGVYDNARAHYANIPTTLEYQHNLSWNDQNIKSYTGLNTVPPWLVRPGKWLIVPDLMIRVPPGLTLNQDYRTKFIESVRYTAPLSLDLSGGKTDRLSQLLAQLTYSSGTSGGG